mgnify:CR=1 FL=1
MNRTKLYTSDFPVAESMREIKMLHFRLMEESGIEMYCDLHAHSRKHNVFIYGCENRRSAERRLQEQVFPLMLHKNAADKVGYSIVKLYLFNSFHLYSETEHYDLNIVRTFQFLRS